MADHNSKITFKVNPQLYLDPNSYSPLYKVDITLSVLLDAQHDGHPWRQEFVDSQESKLVEDIIDKLRPRITEFVKEIKPFSIHGPV